MIIKMALFLMTILILNIDSSYADLLTVEFNFVKAKTFAKRKEIRKAIFDVQRGNLIQEIISSAIKKYPSIDQVALAKAVNEEVGRFTIDTCLVKLSGAESLDAVVDEVEVMDAAVSIVQAQNGNSQGRFLGLLSPAGDLTVEAVSAYLMDEGLLSPGVKDRIKVESIGDSSGQKVEQLFFVKLADKDHADDPSRSKLVYVIKSARDCDEEAEALERLNEDHELISNMSRYPAHPKLALMERAVHYSSQAHQRCFLILHAAKGREVGKIYEDMLDGKISIQEEIQFITDLGRSLGAFHSKNLENKSEKNLKYMRTKNHGDLNGGNILYDKKSRKISFIDNGSIGKESPRSDLSVVLDRFLIRKNLGKVRGKFFDAKESDQASLLVAKKEYKKWISYLKIFIEQYSRQFEDPYAVKEQLNTMYFRPVLKEYRGIFHTDD